MKVKDLNTKSRKKATVIVNKSLDIYDGIVLTPKKVEIAKIHIEKLKQSPDWEKIK